MSHAITWFEIPTVDLDRASRFYETVLGLSLHREDFDTAAMAIFPGKDGDVYGALVKQEGREPSRGGTLPFLDCDGRLRDCLSRVEKAGGSIVRPYTAIGPHGFMAVVVDTEGNAVALHSAIADR